jgi:hypothetical protein
MCDDKIAVYVIDLGFNVEEEVKKCLNEEISEQTLEDADDILDAISQRPSNQKAIAKIKSEKLMQELTEKMLESDEPFTKEQILEALETDSMISAVGKLKTFVNKFYNKKLVKEKKNYKLIDVED